jgi:methionyl-tRNA formyltransferase
LRVVFAGTAAFAVPALEAVARSRHRVELVISQPDRPAGRGLELKAPPVKSAASALGIPVLQPERIKDEAAIQALEQAAPDVLLVVAYGQILPERVLKIPARMPINLHASLLPRHRGPAPIAWSILSGDPESGVTVIQMDAGVDTGPILARTPVAIDARETADTLEAKLAHLGAGLVVETLDAVEEGRVRPEPQPAEGASHAPRLRSDDGRLDPTAMTAEEIDRRVRALSRVPGTWLALPQGQVKVLSGHPDGDADRGLTIETRDGLYVVDEVQPPGGRPMPVDAWLRGRR